MRLFGTSGIRGIANRDVNAELAIRVGMAVAADCRKIVVGHDTRTTADMLSAALIAGATAVGSDVYFAGLVTTPTLAYITRHFDAGVMVTASHNPPEYNGIKLWSPETLAYGLAESRKIEDLILGGNIPVAPWDKVGQLYSYEQGTEEHKKAILEAVGHCCANVVVDCGSGAASVITPLLLREMGCKVTALNAQPDGFFPGREVEPTRESLSDLALLTRKKNADLGVAHDGDGDRAIFVDPEGKIIDTDRILAVIAHILKFKKIVVPVNASRVIEDFNPQAEVIRTRVGDVFVAAAMKKNNAEFGGEPSGTHIFSSFTYCPDGIYTAALMAKLVAEHEFWSVMATLPSYVTYRKNISFASHEEKRNFMRKFASECEPLEGEKTTVDGIRVDMAEGWFLVRPSGTEPKVRITIESSSHSDVEALKKLVQKLLTRAMGA